MNHRILLASAALLLGAISSARAICPTPGAGQCTTLDAAPWIGVAPLVSGATPIVSGTGGTILYNNSGTLGAISSTVQINGINCTLGSTCSITATATSITPGTTGVVSGTSNGLLYDNAGSLGNLTTANNGVLVTNGSGVPSIGTTIPTGVTWNGSAISLSYGGTNASLTASNGGIIYSTASAFSVLSGTAIAGQMLLSGSSAAPSWSTSTWPSTASIGTVLNASGTNTWTATTAPTLGNPGLSMGTLRLAGLTSGTATITPQSAAGTPTLTLPSTSGTLVSNANVPLTISSTTGNIACATCVTSSGGGAISGTAPISVSAAGVVSITNPLPLTNGGLNASLTASNGGIFYSTGSAGAVLAGTAVASQMLLSGASSAPSWSSATWPSSVSQGQMLYASGTNAWAASASPVLGINGSTNGVLNLATAAGGGALASIQNLGTTSAYNFNLPTSAGTSSYLLTSAGGGTSSMTWTSPTVTVNSVACTLGSSCAITASASINVGSSPVGSGSSGYVLYDNAGTLGNYSITGSAGSVVMSSAPTIVSPTITTSFTASGLVTNTSLANMTALSIKCNSTGGSASPTDCTSLPTGFAVTALNSQTGSMTLQAGYGAKVSTVSTTITASAPLIAVSSHSLLGGI